MSDDQPLPEKKLRRDSKWRLLAPGQQQALRDMEAQDIPRSKQLHYFAECMTANGHKGEAWSQRGLSDFWQSVREQEQAQLAAIRRSRAVAADIIAEDKKTGVSLETATGKRLLAIWNMLADAQHDLTSEEGVANLVLATKAFAFLAKPLLKVTELAERKESRLQRERESVRRFATKAEAFIDRAKEEVKGNAPAEAALAQLQLALKEAA